MTAKTGALNYGVKPPNLCAADWLSKRVAKKAQLSADVDGEP